MKIMKKILLVSMMIFVLALYGCGNKEDKEGTKIDFGATASEDNGSAEPSGQQADSGAAVENSGTEQQKIVKEFNVIARQFEFEPAKIEVNKGDTVRINLTSEDTAHSLAITEFGFDLKADGGETKTAEFVADKKGTFTFTCSVFCGSGHREMKGELIVR